MSGRLSEITSALKRQFWRPWSRRELLLLVPCVFVLVATAFVSERLRLHDAVLPGVRLDGEDVSGYTRHALALKLAEREQRWQERLIRVSVDDAVFRFRGDELGVTLPRDRVVAELLGEGRRGNVFRQVAWRLAHFGESTEFHVSPEFDATLWESYVAAFERAVLQGPEEGGLRFTGSKVEPLEPRAGREVDLDEATRRLLAALNALEDGVVELPLRERVPETTPTAVVAVLDRARSLLDKPVVLAPRPLPSELSALALELPAEGDTLRLAPKQLAVALGVRPKPSSPGELELFFPADKVDALLGPLRKQWERPSRDATFVVDRRGTVSIQPSVIGSRIDTEELLGTLLSEATSSTHRADFSLLPAEPPRISSELAATLGVDRLVSQFVTFHPCCRPRVDNIHRIADLVSGTVVLPGETFSLNALVGPRSVATGFRQAPTIVHGKMKDTFGGGISQFTTTLFNAVLDGGYEIIERQPHTFYFDRYPVGHEATLSYPKPDFIFRNDTRYGLVLLAEYGPTFIRIKIYGNNEGRRTTREVSPKFDFTEPPIEYIPQPDATPGQAELEFAGSRGFSVNVARKVTFADGKTSEQARKVTYEPRPRVVKVHPCDIPAGEPGHTGEPCPEPEELDGGVPEEAPSSAPSSPDED